MKAETQGVQTLTIILERSVHLAFAVFLVYQRISFESAYSKKRRSVVRTDKPEFPGVPIRVAART